MSAPEVREVPIGALSLGIQSRAAINDDVAKEYAEAMAGGYGDFEPIDVCEDTDGTLYLYDGHHRTAAARQAGLVAVPARVRPGGRADAVWAAAGANARHGLRRTTADKRNAVALVLLCPQSGRRSNNAIARQVGCDGKTVQSVRSELIEAGRLEPSPVRVGADGRSINTRRIGPQGTAEVSTTSEFPKSGGASRPPDGDPEPPLPFDPSRHAESPEEPEGPPVSPVMDATDEAPAPDERAAHGASPAPDDAASPDDPDSCDGPIATPAGDPDPDVPPETVEGAPPWEGGAADAEPEVEPSCDVAADAPEGLTAENQRRSWCMLRARIPPVLDAIDEHLRLVRSQIERPVGEARSAIMGDTAVADRVTARRTFASLDTDIHGVIEALSKLRHGVEHLLPHEVCPECGGARCRHCRHRGFVFAAQAAQRRQAR